jgi:hypothetical protein
LGRPVWYVARVPQSALRDSSVAWTEKVFTEAGIAPTSGQVIEVAGTIAHLIMNDRLLPFAATNDVPLLFAAWNHDMGVRRENVLDHMDGARSILIVMVADKRVDGSEGPERGDAEQIVAEELDEIINAELTESYGEFIGGVEEEFGVPASEPKHDASVAGAAAGSGCLVALLTVATLAVATTRV